MGSIAHELAHVLTTRDVHGALIYSDRDRSIGIALLAGLETTSLDALGAARPHVEQLYAWAAIEPGDTAEAAAKKIDAYLEGHPVHPALLPQFRRVLRQVTTNLADLGLQKKIGSVWATTARDADDLAASRGSVLDFMINQKRTR